MLPATAAPAIPDKTQNHLIWLKVTVTRTGSAVPKRGAILPTGETERQHLLREIK